MASHLDTTPIAIPLDDVIETSSNRALQYEYQMKELEGRLIENLSNFRTIDNMLQDTFSTIQSKTARAEHALLKDVPHIHEELEEASKTLADLSVRLDAIDGQVTAIRALYNSGRKKAESLMDDLTWLDTDWPKRHWAIVFTHDTPVSVRWRAIIRLCYILTLFACLWFAFIVVRGVVRAHKVRLVWGERLMS